MQPRFDFTQVNHRAILEPLLALARPALVLVAGPTCSGKTTFARWLAHNLPSAEMISTDDYYRDVDDPVLPPVGGKYPRYDVPEACHWGELRDDLRALIYKRVDVKVPTYNISKNRRSTNYSPVSGDHDYYVVEGLYAIQELREQFPAAYKIYLDTNLNICFDRRIRRDCDNMPDINPEVIDYVASRAMDAAQDLVSLQQAQANMVITANSERR